MYCSPFLVNRHLMNPGCSILSHVAHVIVGTGGWLVRKVGRKQWWPIIFNHHYVIPRHVNCHRELVVTWKCDENREKGQYWHTVMLKVTRLQCRHGEKILKNSHPTWQGHGQMKWMTLFMATVQCSGGKPLLYSRFLCCGKMHRPMCSGATGAGVLDMQGCLGKKGLVNWHPNEYHYTWVRSWFQCSM